MQTAILINFLSKGITNYPVKQPAITSTHRLVWFTICALARNRTEQVVDFSHT